MSNRMETLLAHSGLKLTQARLEILTLLADAKAPLSYEQMKQKMAITMDKATFYRNMTLFETHALVHKMESDDRKWYFELVKSPHAHFICEICHQITCIKVDLGHVDAEVKSIVLKGRCKECRS